MGLRKKEHRASREIGDPVATIIPQNFPYRKQKIFFLHIQTWVLPSGFSSIEHTRARSQHFFSFDLKRD